jgi:hypothetical protein
MECTYLYLRQYIPKCLVIHIIGYIDHDVYEAYCVSVNHKDIAKIPKYQLCLLSYLYNRKLFNELPFKKKYIAPAISRGDDMETFTLCHGSGCMQRRFVKLMFASGNLNIIKYIYESGNYHEIFTYYLHYYRLPNINLNDAPQNNMAFYGLCESGALPDVEAYIKKHNLHVDIIERITACLYYHDWFVQKYSTTYNIYVYLLSKMRYDLLHKYQISAIEPIDLISLLLLSIEHDEVQIIQTLIDNNFCGREAVKIFIGKQENIYKCKNIREFLQMDPI